MHLGRLIEKDGRTIRHLNLPKDLLSLELLLELQYVGEDFPRRGLFCTGGEIRFFLRIYRV